MWSSVFPLAHVVVRVSVSVTIMVPMKEAIKEALALHTLREGEREKPIRLCACVYLLNNAHNRLKAMSHCL
jgi:hypothetical protein